MGSVLGWQKRSQRRSAKITFECQAGPRACGAMKSANARVFGAARRFESKLRTTHLTYDVFLKSGSTAHNLCPVRYRARSHLGAFALGPIDIGRSRTSSSSHLRSKCIPGVMALVLMAIWAPQKRPRCRSYIGRVRHSRTLHNAVRNSSSLSRARYRPNGLPSEDLTLASAASLRAK
jgi:hypothetical protein